MCVVYETTVGTPIFSYFFNKFSYFYYLFYLEIPIFQFFEQPVALDTLEDFEDFRRLPTISEDLKKKSEMLGCFKHFAIVCKISEDVQRLRWFPKI